MKSAYKQASIRGLIFGLLSAVIYQFIGSQEYYLLKMVLIGIAMGLVWGFLLEPIFRKIFPSHPRSSHNNIDEN
ncbi:MAG: hypothetical protein U9N55_09995 [candidate division Zixibacteria bacterium]|nr:hypothetical protein [candidate division Zixibacteria bacterium]